jgi:arginyl-tRNA synthetase
VSHVPPQDLAAQRERLSAGLVRMAAGLALVLATVSWFFARSIVERRRAQRQLLQSERLAAIGEAMARLFEAGGATVRRLNYQGDVGMHIAKCLYSLLHEPHKTQMTHMTHTSIQEKVEFLGKAYAAGSKAFEEDAAAKEEIGDINKRIYAKDPAVYGLYRETRQWSLDYFEAIYRRVGSRFDRYYFESEVYESGKKLVRAGRQKGIFEESDGAIIFRGSNYGLHNRVFTTGEGNATYEGKELALATMETTEHGKIDRIIHVVGPEQASFFQVTFKAEELLEIVKPGVQHHLIYGWVKLKHGKMSSRSGNVILGEWLLDEAKKAIYSILEKSESKYTKEEHEEIAEKAAVAAVKYAFLKVGTTSEIAFDIKELVNFQGDSGPYLQYTYARCKSVMRKANFGNAPFSPSYSKRGLGGVTGLNPEERSVLRLIQWFPDVVAEAADELSPSALCTYLFKLAQAYNLFYAKHQILDSSDSGERSDQAILRLSLTAGTAQILARGLYLLGIETLEQM